MNEQDVKRGVRHPPIPVQIVPHVDEYVWQCLDTSGSSPTLAAALSASLTFLIEQFARDALLNDDLLVAIPAGSSMN